MDNARISSGPGVQELRQLEHQLELIVESLFFGDAGGAYDMLADIAQDPQAGDFQARARRYCADSLDGLHPEVEIIPGSMLQDVRQRLSALKEGLPSRDMTVLERVGQMLRFEQKAREYRRARG